MNYGGSCFSVLWKSLFKDWNYLHFERFVELTLKPSEPVVFLMRRILNTDSISLIVEGPLRFLFLFFGVNFDYLEFFLKLLNFSQVFQIHWHNCFLSLSSEIHYFVMAHFPLSILIATVISLLE